VDRVLQELDQKQTKSKKKDNPLKAIIKNKSLSNFVMSTLE